MSKVKIIQEIEAKDTNTTGKKSYLVALRTGGVMEQPDFKDEDYQIINADTPEEAVAKYNQINECSYYYGHLIGEIIDYGG